MRRLHSDPDINVYRTRTGTYGFVFVFSGRRYGDVGFCTAEAAELRALEKLHELDPDAD